MQKIKGKIRLFIVAGTSFLLLRKPKRSPGELITTPSFRLTRTIYECTLEQFICCLVEHNYQALVQEGKPTDVEVFQAWRDIWEGYLDAMKDNKRQYVMKVASQVNVLVTKLNLATLIITRLEYEFKQEIFDELGRLVQLPKTLRWDTPTNRARSIERLKTLRANLERQLANKQIEYQRITPVKASGDGKATRAVFTDLIVAVAKHMQFPIDRHKVFLSEFVGYVVDMREKFERDRKQAQKGKYGG